MTCHEKHVEVIVGVRLPLFEYLPWQHRSSDVDQVMTFVTNYFVPKVVKIFQTNSFF